MNRAWFSVEQSVWIFLEADRSLIAEVSKCHGVAEPSI